MDNPHQIFLWMQDENSKLLNMNNFPIVYGTINILSNTLLYRGYNRKYNPITSRPAYFTSDIDIAKAYAGSCDCEVGMFTSTRELRLYDLRFIRSILRDLFPQRKSNHKDVIECCNTLALAYGVCSYKRQMELLKKRFDNIDKDRLDSLVQYQNFIDSQPTLSGVDPVEAQGVRIAETNNDAEALIFLKEIFGNIVDGYVAPKMHSPYHTEKSGNIHPSELVLFDPEKSGLTKLEKHPNSEKITTIDINLLTNRYTTAHFPIRGFDDPKLIFSGGKTKNVEIAYYETSNAFLEMNEKKIERLGNKAKKVVGKLLGGTQFAHNVKPWPCTEIKSWT